MKTTMNAGMNAGMKTVLIAAMVSIPLLAGSFVLLGHVSGQCSSAGIPAGQDDTADTLLATGLANGGDDPDVGAARAMDGMFIHSGPFELQSDRG